MTEVELRFAKGTNILGGVLGLGVACGMIYAVHDFLFNFDAFERRYLTMRHTWFRELIFQTNGWAAILVFSVFGAIFLWWGVRGFWRASSNEPAVRADHQGLSLHPSYLRGEAPFPYEQVRSLSLGRIPTPKLPLVPSAEPPDILNSNGLRLMIDEGAGKMRRITIAALHIEGSTSALGRIGAFIRHRLKERAREGTTDTQVNEV